MKTIGGLTYSGLSCSSRGNIIANASLGREESIGDRDAFSAVDLSGAAGSTFRSATFRRCAHTRDAVVAVPALPRRHGAPARSPMVGDPEPRDDRSPGWALPIRGCNNQLLGFGRLQILALRPPWEDVLLGLLGLALSRWEETWLPAVPAAPQAPPTPERRFGSNIALP